MIPELNVIVLPLLLPGVTIATFSDLFALAGILPASREPLLTSDSFLLLDI
jgi:hypothetical protein